MNEGEFRKVGNEEHISYIIILTFPKTEFVQVA
jgi:hypothetical protein